MGVDYLRQAVKLYSKDKPIQRVLTQEPQPFPTLDNLRGCDLSESQRRDIEQISFCCQVFNGQIV